MERSVSAESRVLGVALIGCGGMAANYRDAYVGHPNVRYACAVDVDSQLARATAQQFDAPRWASDWRETLYEDVQLADISTPNHLHAEQAVALLDAGKHVLIQKPLAPTIDDCRRIVDAARRSGTVAAVYLSDLEDPIVWDFREIIRRGLIGRVTGFRARYAHRGGLTAPKRPDYWRGSESKTGGGAFIQLSLHQVNLISWLLDDSVESVCGMTANLASPNIGAEDTAAGVARFAKSGAIGVFESSWSAEGSGLQIFGTGGQIDLLGVEGAAASVKLCGPFDGAAISTGIDGIGRRDRVSVTAFRGPGGPKNQRRALVDAIVSGSAPEVSVEMGLADVAVCHALYLSAREKRTVAIDEVTG